MRRYTNPVQTRITPQSQPIPGSAQVPNSAGGFAFQVSAWDLLDRFLILGTESPTYYASERQVREENADNVLACIRENGRRVVARVREISLAGRAPKNDPAIFALALCAKHGNEATQYAAYLAFPEVCRIGTHVFQFVRCMLELDKKGSSGMRRAIQRWYAVKSPDQLALQLVKYREREDLSHADLAYIYRPKLDEEHAALLRWVLERKQRKNPWSKYAGAHSDVPHRLLEGFERIQGETNAKVAVKLIEDYKLPREAVPTELLNSPEIWEALLEDMPMTAMVRNLATMTRVGILAPLSEGMKKVRVELTNAERIRKSRLHPIAILLALKTYAQGRSERGEHTWTPGEAISDALNEAFYLAFANVESTGLNWLLGVDVSGSMAHGRVAGMNLVPAEAAAAMALVTAKTEPNHFIFGFAHEFRNLGISPSMRLDQVLAKTRIWNFGGTDCALPMLYAQSKDIPVDVFVVITDAETWYGNIHPVQALAEYNKRQGRLSNPAKLIVMGMVANKFSIADPGSNNMLDVVGFDAAVPELMRGFATSTLSA